MTRSGTLPTGARVLILSNGHGEDQVGARLAAALHQARSDLRIRALPTVGAGHAYHPGPAERIGPLATLPSAGRTVEGVGPFLADLRAGLLPVTWRQFRTLRAESAELLVAVGDVWIQALGLLPRAGRRSVVQTLVSARMRQGRAHLRHLLRERFVPVERTLMRRGYQQVYLRDEDSAHYLRQRGVAAARFLGNPMMDGLEAPPLPWRPPAGWPRIALLPGTRAHAGDAVTLALAGLAHLPGAAVAVPWAAPATPVPPAGFQAHADDPLSWTSGACEVRIVPGAFAATLAWCDYAVGAAGTAHEQAAGLGKPVIAFPCGPLYTEAFVRNQGLLLGESVVQVAPRPEAIAAVAAAWQADPAERERRGRVGRERMGPPGGSARIAAALIAGTTAGVAASG